MCCEPLWPFIIWNKKKVWIKRKHLNTKVTKNAAKPLSFWCCQSQKRKTILFDWPGTLVLKL